MKPKKPKYGDAARELDEILELIEEGEVDIDDLAEKMQRAAELIELCRGKLHSTELMVKKIAEELDGNAPSVRSRAAAPGEDDEDAPAADEDAAPF